MFRLVTNASFLIKLLRGRLSENLRFLDLVQRKNVASLVRRRGCAIVVRERVLRAVVLQPAEVTSELYSQDLCCSFQGCGQSGKVLGKTSRLI